MGLSWLAAPDTMAVGFLIGLWKADRSLGCRILVAIGVRKFFTLGTDSLENDTNTRQMSETIYTSDALTVHEPASK